MVIRADRVGSDTVLAQIVNLVAQGAALPAPIQRLADKVSFWFVLRGDRNRGGDVRRLGVFGPEPSWTYAVVNAVAVLIIACPCALGLATPMSIMVATGRAAQAGVLFRDAEAIERLRTIDTLVVDKTGTLTQGRPSFLESSVTTGSLATRSCAWPPVSSRAASTRSPMRSSPRPADVISCWWGPTISSPSPVSAYALDVGDRSVALGSAALMQVFGAEVGALAEQAEQLRLEGATAMFLAVDGRAAGMIASRTDQGQRASRGAGPAGRRAAYRHGDG